MVLFVLFQGGGTPITAWNEGEGKFLDKLKKIGDVYTYQNKLYNGFYYNKKDKQRKDFDSDINFDLKYVTMDAHIEMVYNDVKNYKGKFVPLAWSAGGYLALAFAKKYKNRCHMCVLIDSVMISPTPIKARIDDLKKRKYAGLTNEKLKLLQQKIVEKGKFDDIIKMNGSGLYLQTMWAKKHLSLKLPIKTLSFRDIELVENKDNSSSDFNNKLKIIEEETLKKNNKNYQTFWYINKSHQLFGTKDTAIDIVDKINQCL